MSLAFLERELRQGLAEAGHEGLTETALGSVGLTDDGGTIYVHVFPKQGSAKAQGRAFVLAWQDYAAEPSQSLDCYRWLISEARLNMRDNLAQIARWLEGR